MGSSSCVYRTILLGHYCGYKSVISTIHALTLDALMGKKDVTVITKWVRVLADGGVGIPAVI